jgi:hypothetical protein
MYKVYHSMIIHKQNGGIKHLVRGKAVPLKHIRLT